jgi:hypothetical protein
LKDYNITLDKLILQIKEGGPMKNKKEIPQADDVNKISEFPLRVSKNLSSSEDLV